MPAQRSLIRPFLDERQAPRMFRVLVHAVGNAAWFRSRPGDVFLAEPQGFLEVAVPDQHASKHEDHFVTFTGSLTRHGWKAPAGVFWVGWLLLRFKVEPKRH